MHIELRITSGARAGVHQVFDQSIIAIGRHPTSDLRLDGEKDIDVSARHAEIRIANGTATVLDVGSANGTRVNGQPLAGALVLREGDRIELGGAGGVTAEFHVLAAGTTARIAAAVFAQTGRIRRLLYGFVAAVIVIVPGLVYLSRRSTDADRAIIDQLLQELQDQNVAIAQLRSSAAARGLSDEVGRIRQERASVLGALGAGGSSQAFSDRIAELTQRQRAADDVSKVDYEQISEQNTRAVAFVVVQHGDDVEGGSGFGVTRSGIIVTNRHLVQDGAGAPVKIAVQYHGTGKWLTALLMKVSSTDDLAFLKIGTPGAYPTVLGISGSGAVRAGAPVAIVGYPLGTEIAGMGGSIDTLTARASLAAGFVSKSVPDLLQVDAYVAHGSSGSPVFNRRGLVVGVVYGGPAESAGRIAYSVPSDRLIAQLPGEAAGAVKP